MALRISDSDACGFGLFGSVFVALPPHLVRVPTDVPDELETLVRDVLGDRRDEVAGREDLEVTVDLRVHAGTVDDAAVGHEEVKMRVPIEVFAVGVNRHDDSGDALWQIQSRTQVFEQARVRDALSAWNSTKRWISTMAASS